MSQSGKSRSHVQRCCQKYETCTEPCTPRADWLAKREAPSSIESLTTSCREQFDKAGYWPNEVMWKAWEKAWILGKQEGFNLAKASSATLPRRHFLNHAIRKLGLEERIDGNVTPYGSRGEMIEHIVAHARDEERRASSDGTTT